MQQETRAAIKVMPSRCRGSWTCFTCCRCYWLHVQI